MTIVTEAENRIEDLRRQAVESVQRSTVAREVAAALARSMAEQHETELRLLAYITTHLTSILTDAETGLGVPDLLRDVAAHWRREWHADCSTMPAIREILEQCGATPENVAAVGRLYTEAARLLDEHADRIASAG